MNPQQPAAATQQPNNNMDPQQQQQQLYQQQQQQQQQQWIWAQQQQYQAQQQQQPQQAQHQQIWAQQQQYQQAQQAQQQQQVGNGGGGGDEVRTLWIGDLQYWMDETYISNCFANSEIVTVKVIRNKVTLQSEGYGFVDFSSHAAAERVLQTYNGTLMPNVEQTFRLNWASHGSGEKRSDDGSDYTIFVGDLAPDVTDYTLQEAFKAHYPSVKGAKVVMDKLTGRAKGYGFVRFGDENEQLRAMSEMNGVMCSGRAMRIGVASKKTAVGAASYQNTQATQNDSDPNNTTLFVGNLDSSVTDDHLRQTFSQYGEVVHVKIPVGKQCGFVQFTSRSSAEEALSAMNGAQLGGRTIRISWGHNTSNRRPQAEQNQNQWNNTPYYGYPQGQDPYGYAAPQNPNMYYGGYPGYGGYAVPQQAQQPAQQQQ